MKWKMQILIVVIMLVAGLNACEFQVTDEDGNTQTYSVSSNTAQWDSATWDESKWGE